MIGSVGGPIGVAAGIGGGLLLGDLVKRIAGALEGSVRGALQFADEIDDLAEQTGLTKMEVLRLRNAAASAGIGSQKAFGALSSLGAARSAALGGDNNALAAFGRFGVSPAMLGGSGSSLDIGAQIARSLGSGGITATDQGPLRSLLGRRPEQAFAALRAYVALNQGAASETDAALERLANIQTKIEAAQNAFQIFRAKAVAVFPGGYGTLDEFLELLTLIQTGKMKPIPILLFGKEFWTRVVNFDALAEEGVISPDDLKLFHWVETAQDAWAVIREFYSLD